MGQTKVVTYGSLLWAHIAADGKDEPRPCVVTNVSHAGFIVEVVWGRGEPREPDQVLVKERSDLGKLFGLTKDTYFRAVENIYVESIDKVIDELCPPLDLPRFEALAEKLR